MEEIKIYVQIQHEHNDPGRFEVICEDMMTLSADMGLTAAFPLQCAPYYKDTDGVATETLLPDDDLVRHIARRAARLYMYNQSNVELIYNDKNMVIKSIDLNEVRMSENTRILHVQILDFN